MFTRSMYQTDDMIEQHKILEEIAHLVDEGVLKTTLTDEISPINAKNLMKVHASVEAGKHIGKTVLTGF